MKKYIIIILTVCFLGSCHKLDTPPLGVISEENVFTNANAVQAYMAAIYTNLPMEDFVYEPHAGFLTGNGGRWQNFYHSDAIDGEMVGPYGGTNDQNAATGFGFWPYDKIRVINLLISTLPAYASNFTPDQVNEWLGEAYFCRAYTYFALVKRYGGVPIVRTLTDPNASVASLQVPRNTEEDVYNFIASDFDSAFALMKDPGGSVLQGSASKYAAQAYKSRAMLYAGTIAKYGATNYVDGDARAKGFVGIPAADANKFFQAAYDAAKLVEGHFSLYTGGYPDKLQNYVDLFLKPNNENIFLRQYTQSDPNANNDNAGPHSWDATMTCRIMTADGLSRAYPSLDFVERFGALPVVNPDGTPVRFTNRADLMNGLEPRLLATVYFPGATLRGIPFDVQRGLYKTFTGSAAQELPNDLTSPNDVQNGANINLWLGDINAVVNGRDVIGRAGASTNGDDLTRTGFYVRKYIDYNKPASGCGLYQSTESYIDMRYAEVLLNRAEAAMELGTGAMPADALSAINQVRDRAGAIPATASLTIDTIRNERCKELAFEHQYWWDIRRWRTADQVLNNRNMYALLPYYVTSENKYIFLKQLEPFKRTYNFQKLWYYEPLPGGELGKNPNLFPNNPGY
jgi:hypothetical protein